LGRGEERGRKEDSRRGGDGDRGGIGRERRKSRWEICSPLVFLNPKVTILI
jgi:hypothetical protein